MIDAAADILDSTVGGQPQSRQVSRLYAFLPVVYTCTNRISICISIWQLVIFAARRICKAYACGPMYFYPLAYTWFNRWDIGTDWDPNRANAASKKKNFIDITCIFRILLFIDFDATLFTSFFVDFYNKLEICSVEHGICPIAEFTSPWLNCPHSNIIPYPLFC